MTLFAGVYSRHDKPPAPQTMHAIRTELSRSGDKVQEFESSTLYLCKLDIGVFPEKAFIANNVAAALTGELLLEHHGVSPSRRDAELDIVVRSAAQGNLHEHLRDARGNFSLCVHLNDPDMLVLATDLVGTRPMYFCATEEFLYFSSCLRVLRAVAEIPREYSFEAFADSLTFHHPIGDRTPLAGVRAMRGGQVLTSKGRSLQLSHYYKWGATPTTSMSRKELLVAAHNEFVNAVRARSQRDDMALALLSGGLDSRMVVASLLELGKNVHTLTFSPAGYIEGALAEMYARAAGTYHVSQVVEDWFNPRIQNLYKRKAKEFFRFEGENKPRYPGILFAGSGGSVGVGGLYLHSSILSQLRQGNLEEASREFIRKERSTPPRRVFARDIFEQLTEIPVMHLSEELKYYAHPDPGKAMYSFLMDGDQRHHYAAITEDLDIIRTEYMLPFFDGLFLQLVDSIPVDWLLHHAFYNDWVRLFHRPAYETPWQAYPGHNPCPIPLPVNHLRTQWERPRRLWHRTTQDLVRRSLRYWQVHNWKRSPFRRTPLFLAIWLHRLGVRNCASSLRSFELFCSKYSESMQSSSP